MLRRRIACKFDNLWRLAVLGRPLRPLKPFKSWHLPLCKTFDTLCCSFNPLSYTITGGAALHEKVKPKTWRISASADAIWFLRLQVFTTDQPRCYAFDKVLCPPDFYRKKLWLSCFRDKSSRKNSFFFAC